MELLYSPEEGCGGNRKFGNKMATSTVEKYASGRGERNIDINRRESLFKIIKERFGDRHKRLARTFEHSHIKRARLQNHLKFMKRCRNDNIIPRGMRSHISKQDLNNPNVLKLTKKIELVRLRRHVKDTRWKLFQNDKLIAQYRNELNDVISDDNLIKELISWCNKAERIEHAKVKERQLKKLRC